MLVRINCALLNKVRVFRDWRRIGNKLINLVLISANWVTENSNPNFFSILAAKWWNSSTRL